MLVQRSCWDCTAAKLDCNYQGPFTIVKANKNNSYIVRDALGNLLLKPVPLSQIKIILGTKWICDENHAEIEGIVNHRGKGDDLEYFVLLANLLKIIIK